MNEFGVGQSWIDVDYVGDGIVGHRLDVLLPVVGHRPFATVVIIYGSAFLNNDGKGEAVEALARPLLGAGFAVVAINHRSSLDAIWPAQIHDVKAAIRFVRASADRYGLDPEAIGVTGYLLRRPSVCRVGNDGQCRPPYSGRDRTGS